MSMGYTFIGANPGEGGNPTPIPKSDQMLPALNIHFLQQHGFHNFAWVALPPNMFAKHFVQVAVNSVFGVEALLK